MRARRLAAFDPRFIERSPLFWPIARAARAVLDPLGTSHDFPPVDSLERVFEGDRPVRFALAPPRSRRRRAGPVDVTALYDARITLEKTVPTRACSWHDLMNALVWGTFPRSKAALHARQHRAIAERVVPGARTLPATRTRELDALALLDEGGVVVLARDLDALREAFRNDGHESFAARIARGAAEPIVFGHAIYESLALGIAPAVVAAVVIDVGALEGAPSPSARAIDERLAEAIEDAERLRTPEELTRVMLPTSTPRVACASHQPPDESLRPLAPRALPSAPR
jgi:hypothetical protein